MYTHRIKAPLVSSTLDYGLWSDSGSGHFTLTTSRLVVRKLCWLFRYVTLSLAFPSQETPSSAKQFVVTTDNHYWKRSVIHSAKLCSQRHVWRRRVCCRIFLLCIPLKYNFAMSLTHIWHSVSYHSQNRESLWKIARYITTKRD